MRSLTEMLDESRKLLEIFDISKLSMEMESILKNIFESWSITFGNPELKKRFLTYFTKFSNSENNVDQIRTIIELFKDNTIQDALNKFIVDLANGVEKIFFKSSEIDTNLYDEFINQIFRSKGYNFDISKNIIEDYSNVNKNMIEIDTIINSVLIFREIFTNQNEGNKVFSIFRFKMKFEKIITFLKECDQQNFKIYLFDLLMKLSFIIESHVKNVMRLILKLDNLLNRKEYDVDSYELAKLFRILRQNPVFKDYRNSIFHSDFIINYNPDISKTKILFKYYKNEPVEWTIDEIFENFTKIILLVKTVDAALLSTSVNKKVIFELIDEFFKLINSKTENDILNELLKDDKFLNIYNKIVNTKFLEDEIKQILDKSNNNNNLIS